MMRTVPDAMRTDGKWNTFPHASASFELKVVMNASVTS